MIELKAVTKRYHSASGVTEAIRGIDLHVRSGEIFGVIGHSGAGKSTLLRCVNLLERPTSGSVVVGGTELTRLSTRQLQQHRRRIGIIFQHFNLLSTATVHDNVAFPLRLARQPRSEIRARVDELLGLVGLEGYGDRYPSQLSGGQKQRVGIARALANKPDVLLCDEATSALDPQTTDSILSLLLDINEKLGLTIMLITHEMHVIRSICDRVAVIDQGEIVEMGDVIDVFLHPRAQVTQDFVEQSTHASSGFPSEEGIRRGRLLRVRFKGKQTYEPVLFEAVKETGAVFSILQGTVSRMKRIPYGQLLVDVRGSDGDVERIVARLHAEGIEAEVLA
ncbi:methionine ABC transporter ATP-binding protein [Paenibacillus curdlanolyticus]|uniref:methionine ABC transporter ATP-binding protein n=1 Tax=Paenibacillus curdlanolyticus TaxID=59840 RepID=UPI00059260CF|nr:ATP-binding cassette domain-containing protein [Paenibacillus curdlanolyticus]